MAHYVVRKEKIVDNINRLKNAFSKQGLNFQLFYSVKSNSAKLVLETAKGAGAEFEIVSDYEWDLIKNFKIKEVVLNGPGKSLSLAKNITNNIEVLYFNIDNDTDFDILRYLDKKILYSKIKIGLRGYLDLSRTWNRFGYKINTKNFVNKIKLINSISKLSGIHFHFSTNNFDINNYKAIFLVIKKMVDKYKLQPEFLDIGGGLPAANEDIYSHEVYNILPKLITNFFPDIRIISEAGRNIIADAVNIESKVISKKKIRPNQFDVAVDTNIMHFPCFHEKKFWLEYLPARKNKKSPTKITVFGNSCMQIDEIMNNIMIEQEPFIGDKVIIHNVGAYSISQAANFISKMPKIITHE